MSGGGDGGTPWKPILGVGLALCAAAVAVHHAHVGPAWLSIALSAIGGLATIFGSCEAMILSVDGLGERLRWNPFVAGTMAGLASNVPEIVMIGFVVAADPRVAFVVACLTLHVNSLVFGIYSGLLPKDASGHAHLPEAIIKQGTDLIICGAGVFLAMGILMLAMHSFDAGNHKGEGLGAGDLIFVGAGLLLVQVVAVKDLIQRFADAKPDSEDAKLSLTQADEPGEPASWGRIAGFGALGMGTSLVGGHAVGDFADGIVKALTERDYPEMVGAIIVSLFAGIASYLMVATAHMKGKYELALSNVSGAVTQVPFVILPATMIIMGVMAMLGVVKHLEHGGVLAIDLETTMVVFFGAPTLLILWNSIADDGKVNKLETTIMVVLFGIIIYFLGVHG